MSGTPPPRERKLFQPPSHQRPGALPRDPEEWPRPPAERETGTRAPVEPAPGAPQRTGQQPVTGAGYHPGGTGQQPAVGRGGATGQFPAAGPAQRPGPTAQYPAVPPVPRDEASGQPPTRRPVPAYGEPQGRYGASGRPPGYEPPADRPWPMVSWWYSLLFVVPVLILIVMGIQQLAAPKPPAVVTMQLAVTDAYSRAPIVGAVITVGTQQVATDAAGIAFFTRPDIAQPITVQALDYEAANGTVDASSAIAQAVALRPTSLSGRLTDKGSGQPIAGATISVVTASGPSELATTTDANGAYRLTNVPPGATIRIDAGDYGTAEVAAGQQATLDVALALSIMMGTILDTTGSPVPNATILVGEQRATTKADGTFRLANAPESGTARVMAPGFVTQEVAISVGTPLSVALDVELIRAIYVSASSLSDPAKLDELIELVDTTELNAMVLDIKEDYVWYDSQVPFFVDAGAVLPVWDPADVVQKLDERGIYSIARMVVFKDPIVAEARLDLAVQSDLGGVWRDGGGAAWVNPFETELWDANLALALEAASFGFDEIQYDYIRFPSDGDLTIADFGREYTFDARVGAIVDFLDMSHEAINEMGAMFAIDVFGIVALYDDDQGIGQYFRELVQHVDYICPMVYPSHFDAGSIDVGGEPNDFPYDVIAISMWGSQQKTPEDQWYKIRPWLQDFSLPGMMPYGPDEVRAQIDAAEENGASGWLIWNAGNNYDPAAYKPT